MSFCKAISLMAEGFLIIHKKVAYAIIDERVCVCRYNSEENKIEHYHEVSSPLNVISMSFDTFTSHLNVNVFRRPPVPEFYVIEDGSLYDFSRVPTLNCPDCLSLCSRETAYREGRYALCPGCNKRFFKASRLDGVRDFVPKKEEPVVLKRQREPKKVPTNSEIVERLLNDSTNRVSRKITF